MKGRCPKCDAPIELEQAARDQASRELLDEVTALGARGRLVLEYVEAFRATPASSLAPAKALRLVREVRALIESGRFAFDGGEYGVSLEIIDEGLREVGNRSLIGLHNHNYFYQVLRGMIGKRAKQRSGVTLERSAGAGLPRELKPAPKAGPVPVREGGEVDLEEIRRFNESFEGIGKPMPKGEEEDDG